MTTQVESPSYPDETGGPLSMRILEFAIAVSALATAILLGFSH